MQSPNGPSFSTHAHSPSYLSALLNLASMMWNVLPCIFPIPYGCWCGITIPFPAPEDPIDEYDATCKTHDFCYEDGALLNCTSLDEYVWLYSWDLTDDGRVVCDAFNNDACQQHFCECDRDVTHGLAALVEQLGGGECPVNPGCEGKETQTFLENVLSLLG